MAIIVLDFSKPWTLAATLQKWLKILADQLKASPAAAFSRASEEQLRAYAQTYPIVIIIIITTVISV